MEPERKALAEAFISAIERENLTNRQAAEYLNIPSYAISLLKKEKHWRDVSKAVWSRLNVWMKARVDISEYVIPEGEKKLDQFAKSEKKSRALPDVDSCTHAAPGISDFNKNSIRVREAFHGGSLPDRQVTIPPLRLVLDIDLRISVNGVPHQFDKP